jgi:hypothetical protein
MKAESKQLRSVCHRTDRLYAGSYTYMVGVLHAVAFVDHHAAQFQHMLAGGSHRTGVLRADVRRIIIELPLTRPRKDD